MLLLPAKVTAADANDTCRLLTQALKGEPDATIVVDASNLQQFDSSVLAVLLECERAADAWGKPFATRNAPPKLAALAELYGVDTLLFKPAVPA
jgi:phospholipid transport system transporter-binding protein